MENCLTKEELNEGMFMNERTECLGADSENAQEALKSQENADTKADFTSDTVNGSDSFPDRNIQHALGDIGALEKCIGMRCRNKHTITKAYLGPLKTYAMENLRKWLTAYSL